MPHAQTLQAVISSVMPCEVCLYTLARMVGGVGWIKKYSATRRESNKETSFAAAANVPCCCESEWESGTGSVS